jgi:cytidine deaminase
MNELAIPWPELLDAATRGRAQAYAPYSRYAVGAAVLAKSGRVYAGANLENASYGLSVCAERNAVAAAIAAGEKQWLALAVVTESSPPASPCGACRQVLAEFADDLAILLANDRGEQLRLQLADLLPHQFRFRGR